MKKKNLINIFKVSFNLKNKKQLEMFVKKNTRIFELENYDSLAYLKLISKIEKNFNIKINQKNISKMHTFRSAYNFLKSKEKI
jgi:acyl carrier protein